MSGPHDPGAPDGENRSLSLAVSATGAPEIGRLYEIPARCGLALRLAPGDRLSVINPSGAQVCDFWAFADGDLHEHLSMAHLHTALGRLTPRPGDTLVSNLRRPLLAFEVDSSPGVHDTLIAACDLPRYRQLGVEGYHDNCADNLRMALIAIGLRAPLTPAPLNLWMNTPIDADGAVAWLPTVAAPGDRCVFRALRAVIVALSACPQDLLPINSGAGAPQALAVRVDRVAGGTAAGETAVDPAGVAL